MKPTLRIVVGDPGDVTTERCRALQAAITAHPGRTPVTMRIGKTLMALPDTSRVHVGPPFLRALRDASGPSWTWTVDGPGAAPRPARRPPAAARS